MNLGVGCPSDSRRVSSPRHPSLVGDKRYNSDGTPFWVCRVYNGTGGALVANRPYMISFEGAAATTANPQLTALAAQTGVPNQIVIALTTTANGEWGDVVYQGYHDCGVEGTTDVTADDYLKVDAVTSSTGLVKDSTSRTAQSCAIAMAAQTTNSVVDIRVYLVGSEVLTSLASPETTVALTGASTLTTAANDSTSARFSVINSNNGTDAGAVLQVSSATGGGSIGHYPTNHTAVSSFFQDCLVIRADSDTTAIVYAATSGSQEHRFRVPTTGTILTLGTAAITVADATNFVFNTGTGTKFGTATTQKIGFYNATPIVQPGAYVQTFATADRTHAARTATALTVVDGVGTNDGSIAAITADASVIAAVQELAAAINALIVDLADTASVVNSLVDDHQALGFAS